MLEFDPVNSRTSILTEWFNRNIISYVEKFCPNSVKRAFRGLFRYSNSSAWPKFYSNISILNGRSWYSPSFHAPPIILPPSHQSRTLILTLIFPRSNILLSLYYTLFQCLQFSDYCSKYYSYLANLILIIPPECPHVFIISKNSFPRLENRGKPSLHRFLRIY